jgi:hypothetical protein
VLVQALVPELALELVLLTEMSRPPEPLSS